MVLNHMGVKTTELQKCPGPSRSNFTFSPLASYDMTWNLQQLASAHFYKCGPQFFSVNSAYLG